VDVPLLAAAIPIAAVVMTAVPPRRMIRILFMSPRWSEGAGTDPADAEGPAWSRLIPSSGHALDGYVLKPDRGL
jgi:hypothetical protein